MVRFLVLAVMAMGLVLAGCDLGYDDGDDSSSSSETEVASSDAGQDTPAAGPGQDSPADDVQDDGGSNNGGGLPVSLNEVVWLHTDVSDWSQTANLSDVRVQGNIIFLDYDKSRSWPSRSVNGTPVNANAWIFVNQGGTWYAGTWEWLKPGQTSKSVAAVRGDHIKVSPLNNFVPRSGTQYGFMVSGLARTSDHHNVAERSNVVMMTWP